MNIKQKFTIAAGILTGALFATSINAQDVDNRANIYVGAVNYIFDDEKFLEDDIGVLLGGEFPISERWAVGIEYWDLNADIFNSPGDTDVSLSRLGLNYHFDKKDDWQPYLSAGFGLFDADRNLPFVGLSNERSADFGLGVKRYLSNNILLRGDAKALMGYKENTIDYALSIAVGYAFGSKPAMSSPAPVAAAPMDSDGDGVMDNADSCRNTPAGMAVNARGCELDSDRDGVVDSRDNCPDTAMALAVDRNGCPILEASMMHQTLEVNFDTDRSVIKPEYDMEIREFAEFMQTYSNTDAVIEGHTDSRGESNYNQGLSERRANAVMNELITEYGVSGSRLSAVGFGESDPVAANTTAVGRASNRRIDAEVSVEVEQQRQR